MDKRRAPLPKRQPTSNTPSFAYEEALRGEGYCRIAGVDEAGRGPLAGPVVAACCILPPDGDVAGIKDSKLLKGHQREALFHRLTEDPNVEFAWAIVDEKVIDEINILQATIKAMIGAVAKLKIQPDYLLVDGMGLKAAHCPNRGIIKGDRLCYSIAAASIIAKVVRDREMEKWDKEYPEYGFIRHKGYGTRGHMEALERYGVSPIHRLSFAPCRECKI